MPEPSCDILLVEDDAADAELALRALASLALAVRRVADGETALADLRSASPRARPRVVLLDLKLPGIDGFQVLAAIRAEPAICMLPVVVLTSSREDRDVERSYALGANGYVVKPVDSVRFGNTLREIGAYWTALNVPPHRA